MRQLIWKEWHEQSWRLGFGCVVLGAMALIGLHARLIADDNMMLWVGFIGITLLPVLSSTGLLPAERSEGSFESLLALPVAPWKILAAKTAMGLLLCVGPLAVAAVISLIVAGGREMTDSDIMHFYAASVVTAVSLFIWMMALTSRLPSEGRSALVAIGILIIWSIATGSAAAGGLNSSAAPKLLKATSPLMAVWATDPHSFPFIVVVIVQSVMAIALWTWMARRIVRPADGES
jgi:ABC-type transport system involved in multi-copper enzyme maturation permease subunit